MALQSAGSRAVIRTSGGSLSADAPLALRTVRVGPSTLAMSPAMRCDWARTGPAPRKVDASAITMENEGSCESPEKSLGQDAAQCVRLRHRTATRNTEQRRRAFVPGTGGLFGRCLRRPARHPTGIVAASRHAPDACAPGVSHDHRECEAAPPGRPGPCRRHPNLVTRRRFRCGGAQRRGRRPRGRSRRPVSRRRRRPDRRLAGPEPGRRQPRGGASGAGAARDGCLRTARCGAGPSERGPARDHAAQRVGPRGSGPLHTRHGCEGRQSCARRT